MRVVTWNCRKASAQSRVWDYLLELAPDLALLQEVCGIPQHVKRRYASVQQYPVRKNGSPQQFTMSTRTGPPRPYAATTSPCCG